MKALITGITGMVGSHLLDFLIENTDWEIHGLIRWRSPLENIVQHLHRANDGDRLFLHYCDICDYTGVDNALSGIKFDFVFHLAAQSYPQVSFTNPHETYLTNINGTENVLRAVLKHSPNAAVHVCSSSEVFGRVPKELIPINENCPFHPASPYAISKCSTDLIGRYYSEAFGLRTLITRMFTHTGPRRGDVFMESTFAKQIALIEAGFIEPIVKVGNLDSLRTIADVRDAVRAYYLLVVSDAKPGSTFNIGGTTSKRVGDILSDLISLSSLSSEISFEVDSARLRPIDADLQVPDVTKFKSEINWEPEIPYEKTIHDLLVFWRKKVAQSGDSFLIR